MTGNNYTNTYNNCIVQLDVLSNKIVHVFSGHTLEVNSIDINQDCSIMITGSTDKTVKIWDIAGGKCIFTYSGHNDGVTQVGFGSNQKEAFSLSSKELMRWDVLSGECIRTYKTKSSADSFSVSPDSRNAAVGNYDDEVQIFDVETGECVNSLQTEGIVDMYYSIDGSQIFVLSETGVKILSLDIDLTFPGWQDWDEGARPCLEIFRNLHPQWTEDDFNSILIPDLQNRGYGWLRPEGVRKKLGEMA
jgi:WD40 repeat protein